MSVTWESTALLQRQYVILSSLCSDITDIVMVIITFEPTCQTPNIHRDLSACHSLGHRNAWVCLCVCLFKLKGHFKCSYSSLLSPTCVARRILAWDSGSTSDLWPLFCDNFDRKLLQEVLPDHPSLQWCFPVLNKLQLDSMLYDLTHCLSNCFNILYFVCLERLHAPWG